MPDPVDLSGATKLKIDLRKLEPVVRLLHRPQTLILVFLGGEEVAIGLVRSSSHPSSELMQLGQSEPFRRFDADDGGIRIVHSDLDHGSGRKDRDIPAHEPRHHLILLFRLHLAMQEADSEIRENVFEILLHLSGIRDVERLGLGDQG